MSRLTIAVVFVLCQSMLCPSLASAEEEGVWFGQVNGEYRFSTTNQEEFLIDAPVDLILHGTQFTIIRWDKNRDPANRAVEIATGELQKVKKVQIPDQTRQQQDYVVRGSFTGAPEKIVTWVVTYVSDDDVDLEYRRQLLPKQISLSDNFGHLSLVLEKTARVELLPLKATPMGPLPAARPNYGPMTAVIIILVIFLLLCLGPPKKKPEEEEKKVEKDQKEGKKQEDKKPKP